MSDDLPVIALLCSAGGLDALTRVLAPLPGDLPAAVLVLQHLAPERASTLPAILGARTALTVAPAVDGDLLIAGRVLVAPAGQHTLIHGQRIVLIPSGPVPPYRPSADLLLTTLAIAAGPRVIAVVLSGKGNDAATGATAVHRFGGTVIACSTETSTQPAMPQAVTERADVIDQVVPLDDLAGLLITLTTAPLLDPNPAEDPPPEPGPQPRPAGTAKGSHR